jgi:hypothetical protein
MTAKIIEVFKLAQPNIGLFAQLNYCLLLSKYCNENKLEPYFIINGKANIDPTAGMNCFDYYFNHKRLSQNSCDYDLHDRIKENCIEIRSRYDINKIARGNIHNEIQNELSTLREGIKLFNKYICIKKHVNNLVDDYSDKNFINKNILGLHYRGLDKHNETTLASYEAVLSILKTYKENFDSIFIATDEPELLSYVSQLITNKKILVYSNPTGKLHLHDNSNNYQKGLDALVDSLLLSRCNLLIKTPSLLSAWSKIFNPRLPVILLGRPDRFPNNERGINGYGYYPESVLHKNDYLNKLRNRIKRVVLPGNNTK